MIFSSPLHSYDFFYQMSARYPLAGVGPKSKVFFMHLSILPTLPLIRAHVQANRVQPLMWKTMKAYAIGHQESNIDVDSSSRSLMRILQRTFVCAPPARTPVFGTCDALKNKFSGIIDWLSTSPHQPRFSFFFFSRIWHESPPAKSTLFPTWEWHALRVR